MSGAAQSLALAALAQAGPATPWYGAPPVAAHFPVTVGSPTVTDDPDLGLVLEIPKESGPVTRALMKTIAAPAADWKFTAKIVAAVDQYSFSGFGVIIGLAAVPDKAIIMQVLHNGTIDGATYYFSIGGQSAYDNYQVGRIFGGEIWMQIEHVAADSKNYFRFGNDGKHFIDFIQLADTDWLGAVPDLVGFATVNNRSSGSVGAAVVEALIEA